jgi:uncharacterized protein (TIGR03067 family)
MRALLMLAVFAVAVPDRQDPTPKESRTLPGDQILGDWKDDRGDYAIRFLPGESAYVIGGQVSPGDGLTANVVFDWTQAPVHIDFMPKQRGGKMMGILKIEGDRLTLCVNTGGGSRPTVFGNPNNNDLLLSFSRMRK